jgi:hypothetical protein
MLLANNDVRALRRLLTVALKNGAGPAALIHRIERSIEGTYKPRGGFSTLDYDKAFLVKALGGPRLLEALHRAEGYPSLTTLRVHKKVPLLLTSVSIPTKSEIDTNISSLFDPTMKPVPTPTSSGKLPGLTAMVDGIALEEVCRYDSHRDCIVGLCREHSGSLDPTVRSLEAVQQIEKALYETKTCCHGKDGTVLAIAAIADREHYTPIPILLSPSCKRETGVELARWLKTVIGAWKSHPNGEAMYGPLWTIASDGESSFRVARFELCMSEDLDMNSDLGKILYNLPGLNCQTGPDCLLATCDPKHVIKRFATLLRCLQGIIINDTNLTPLHTIEHLAALPGVTVETARDLMDPADKQNVPKAVTLIQELMRLSSIEVPLLPDHAQRRTMLIFLSKTLGYFVLPFITVDMDLSEQLRSLSTYAHLTCAMYIKHGLAFMTGALYGDSQAIVKNVVFTVGRLQRTDPLLEFYLILEGTDRLEGLFSNCRTQDHSRNFDSLQLSQKLSIAAEVTATFERNPTLDRGHRRRILKDAKGIDHINPKSFTGRVCVGEVDIRAEWLAGSAKANELLLKEFGYTIDFVERFRSRSADLLQPDGKSYVGSRYSPDDSLSEEEAVISETPSPLTSSAPHPSSPVNPLSAESILEPAVVPVPNHDDDDGEDNGGSFGDEPEIDVEDFLEAHEAMKNPERETSIYLDVSGKKIFEGIGGSVAAEDGPKAKGHHANVTGTGGYSQRPSSI